MHFPKPIMSCTKNPFNFKHFINLQRTYSEAYEKFPPPKNGDFVLGIPRKKINLSSSFVG